MITEPGAGSSAAVTSSGTPVGGRLGHRSLFTATGAAGVAYPAAWIAGLSVDAPSPSLSASGRTLLTAYAGHAGAVAAQYLLVEGLAGALLAVVVAGFARLAWRRAANAARVGAGAGLVAAAVSVTQCVLGLGLAHEASSRAGRDVTGSAHLLFDLANRLDGVKMIALAAFACGAATLARRGDPLRRWIGVLGLALGVSLLGSAVAYGLLLQPIAFLAYVSGPLLLVFVAALAISLPAVDRSR